MVEHMFEFSMLSQGRSCGTAGGVHLQLNRVAQQPKERSPETLGFETRAERDLMLVLHRPIEPRAIDLPLNDDRSRIAEDLMPAQKVEHDIVEAARLLPGHGVPGIVDDGPFVIA